MSPSIQQRPYRFLAVAAVGTFLGTLEGSILNVALPTMAGELGVAIDTIAWVVLAYSLTLVSLMMVFGGWASRTGYGFAYRFGYSVFIAGTAICIFSDAFYPLVVGRVVQAVGSAMFQAIGMGLVTTVFPAAPAREGDRSDGNGRRGRSDDRAAARRVAAGSLAVAGDLRDLDHRGRDRHGAEPLGLPVIRGRSLAATSQPSQRCLALDGSARGDVLALHD